MGETLTQQRRVSEEGLRIVKLFYLGKIALWPISIKFDGTKGISTG
jgi:hypothetical protein